MTLKPDAAGDKSRFWLLCLALVAGVWAAHGPILNNDFITFDDQAYVYSNPQVLNGLTFDGIVWAFSHFSVGNWHPVTMLGHMLGVTLFGLNPSGHHAMALILHGLNACLLFAVVTRLTRAPLRSWFVAALFAVHPVHVESVAWVSSLKDVLSVFFLCLTLLSYLSWLESKKAGVLALSLLLYALALMSKPTAVVFPLLLILLDYWPLDRLAGRGATASVNPVRPQETWATLLTQKAPFVALAAAGALITVIAQSTQGAVAAIENVPFQDRLLNAANSYVQYLRTAFYPADLSLIYPLRPIPLLPGILQIIGLLCITAGALWAGRKRVRGYWAVGWLWFVLAMVPMIGLIQVGVQARADRYAYIPFIGLYLLVVWAVADLAAARPQIRKAVLAGSVAVLILLAGAAHQQSRLWESPVTLMLHGIQATGDNPDLEDYLGRTYNLMGDYESAARHFRRSIQLRPGDPEPIQNLAFALMVLDQPKEAAALYEQLAAMGPMGVAVRINMGWAQLKSGDAGRAREIFEKLAAEHPDNAEVLLGLGASLGATGDVEGALLALEKARRHQGLQNAADYQIALVLVNAGRADQALASLTELVNAQPVNYAARRLWAQALEQTGDIRGARAVLEGLLKERPDDTLARAALEKLNASAAGESR